MNYNLPTRRSVALASGVAVALALGACANTPDLDGIIPTAPPTSKVLPTTVPSLPPTAIPSRPPENAFDGMPIKLKDFIAKNGIDRSAAITLTNGDQALMLLQEQASDGPVKPHILIKHNGTQADISKVELQTHGNVVQLNLRSDLSEVGTDGKVYSLLEPNPPSFACGTQFDMIDTANASNRFRFMATGCVPPESRVTGTPSFTRGLILQ